MASTNSAHRHGCDPDRTRRCPNLVQRRGGRAEAARCRLATSQARIGHARKRPVQEGRWFSTTRAATKMGKATTAWACLPALEGAADGVQASTSTPWRRLATPAAPRARCASLSRGQASVVEPGIALRPGQQAFVLGAGVARCTKAVAAGKVVDTGPGRHGRNSGAVVVVSDSSSPGTECRCGSSRPFCRGMP